MGTRPADDPGTPQPQTRWVKGSLSFAHGNCVEVARLADGHVGVRHSQHPQGPVLRFTFDEWQAFLHGARDGEFDGLAGH